MHKLETYKNNDVDIGVDPLIYTKVTEEYEEKKKFLINSFYDFILKLHTGPN